MKILSVEITNITSIEGPYLINFEDERFANIGLFGITGPVGAGKSTIIDAICLGLYNTTPRLDRQTNSTSIQYENESLTTNNPQNLLRRGAGSGSVHVRFTGIDGQIWKSTWLLRRARDLANGKLQGVTMILFNESLNEVFPENKISKITEKIKSLIGLDFKQFTKSVILAQGDFQAFLNATETERAQILEKLTGTEIYSEISKGIYEKTQQIKNDYIQIENQIKTLSLLSNEELLELKTTIKDIRAELEKLEAVFNELQTYEAWYKTEHELNTQFANINNDIQLIENQLNDLQNETIVLANVEKVQSIKPVITEKNEANVVLNNLENEVVALNEQAQVLYQQKNELVKQIEVENTTLKNIQKQITTNEPLYKKARELDVLITKSSETIANTQANAKNNTNELNVLNQKFTQLVALVQNKKQSISDLNNWFTENKNVKKWAENSSFLNNLFTQVLQINSQIQSLLNDHKFHKTKAENIVVELNSLEAQKVSFNKKHIAIKAVLEPKIIEAEKQDVSQLITKQKNLQTSLNTLKDLYKLANDLNKLNLQKQQTESELKKLKTTQENEINELSKVHEQVKLLSKEYQEQSIYVDKLKLESSENIIQLRNQLTPGCECPVCGSTTHNITHTNGITTVLEKAAEKLKAIANNKEEAQTLQTKLKTSITFATNVIENLNKSLENHNKEHNLFITQWQEILSKKLVNIRKNTTDTDIENEIKKFTIAIEQVDKEIETANVLQKEIANFTQEINQIQIACDDIEKQINVLRIQQETHKNKLEEIANQGIKLRENEVTTCEQIDTILNLPDWKISFKENASHFTELITNKIALWESNLKKEEVFKTELQNLVNDCEKTETIINEKNKLLALITEELNAETTILNNRKAERNTFFNGKAIDEVETVLKNNLTKKNDFINILNENEKIINNNLLKTQTSVQEKNNQINSTKQKITSSISNIKSFIEYWNTQNEYKLNTEKLQELCNFNNDWIVNTRKKIDAIKQQKASLIGSQQVLVSQISKHQANNKPNITIQDLESNKSDVLLKKQQINESLLALNTKLLNHENNIKSQQSLLEKCNKIAPEYNEWQELNNLLGSASGDRLKKFAQQFTLDLLLQAANAQLQQINNRYILERIEESLSILVIDQYMGDTKRATNSLSGGETFLVSLALSLALSTISSTQLQVESLFIDEGFGSLDPNSLETAFLALENIQNQGRMIGVISHLDAVIDRLTLKIQVTPQGNGKSKIEIIT